QGGKGQGDYEMDDGGMYSEDMKNQAFGGSDAKKRRGVSLRSLPFDRLEINNVQRAAPPGRCHSCNRAETPEWRRGPDGARTLCNACGLRKPFKQKRLSRGRWLNIFFPTSDYAKLMR